jgi:general secretion pathway protein G
MSGIFNIHNFQYVISGKGGGNMNGENRYSRAFTLIELLIVVAIIAILAAIAVPNFLEAQVRSKVSRAKADMRTIATAIESYRVDNNNYPPENWQSPDLVTVTGTLSIPNMIKLIRITTPLAYLTSVPGEPFAHLDDAMQKFAPPTYHYAAYNDPLYPGAQFFRGQNPEGRYLDWLLQSNGPDKDQEPWQYPRYDPTNGTVSVGNIMRFGP